MKKLLLMISIFPLSLDAPKTTPEILVIWNVGQGSWATQINSQGCLHIDAGGEVSPLEEVSQLCLRKKNLFFLSHWDWDHFSFLSRLNQRLPNLCLAARSNRPVPIRSRQLLLRLKKCATHPQKIAVIFSPSGRSLTKNDSSLIIVANNQVLLPGDSTKKMERLWLKRLSSPERVKTLVLGHHGSKTSTSEALLAKLSGLKQAIVSSRYGRYRHPHASVLSRLSKYQIPVISTEDWGNIFLELSSN